MSCIILHYTTTVKRSNTHKTIYEHIIILSERRHHRIVPNPTCRLRRRRGFRAVRTVIMWESRVENKTPTTARLSVGLPQNTRLLYTFIHNICAHTPLWHGTYHYYYFNRYLCTRVIDKISCHNTCAIYIIAVMRGSEDCCTRIVRKMLRVRK